MTEDKKYKATNTKITNKAIDAMTVPKSTPRKGKKARRNINRLWDAKITGFSVICTTGGSKSFYYVYKNKAGKVQSYHIGKYPELTAEKARAIAKEKAAEVAQGKDPHRLKRTVIKEGSFAEYSVIYLKTLINKSAKKEKYMHSKYLVPAFGSSLLNDIAPVDIEVLRGKYQETPYQANQMKVYLHKFFVWCVKNRFMNANPCTGIKNYPEKARNFVATDTQLLKISQYLKDNVEEKPRECYFIGLLIATGCRPSEIYLRKWIDLDWETQQLQQVETKTGTRSIDLSPTAMSLLERLKPLTFDISPYMFPSRYDLNKPRVTWRSFWYELRDFVGFDNTVQMRDMRHHFATIQLKKSKDIATVSALLGHSNVATTSKHYAHVLQDTKQKLLKSTAKEFKVI